MSKGSVTFMSEHHDASVYLDEHGDLVVEVFLPRRRLILAFEPRSGIPSDYYALASTPPSPDDGAGSLDHVTGPVEIFKTATGG